MVIKMAATVKKLQSKINDDGWNITDVNSSFPNTKLSPRIEGQQQIKKNYKNFNGRDKYKRKKDHEEKRPDSNEHKRTKMQWQQEKKALPLSGGFVWDADPSMLQKDDKNADSDDSLDDERAKKDEKKKKKRLTKAEKREKAMEEEAQIRAAEQKLINSEGPQSADDFDRLILSSPNSSLCWIKYMAFHLQAAEIDKARSVARRALSTISFREEQEKLNVWCALLSLENLYGTKESLDGVLKEALVMNDPCKTYLQMLQLYADSGKIEEADKLIKDITKKYSDNKEVWMLCGEVLLTMNKAERSRALMQKALTVLDKKVHVEVISRFAHFENRLGNPERAHTLMEFILTSYPKRVDIWSSYVDMLVKNKQLDVARQVLERAVAQNLPLRKMKILFSKFVQFEEQQGTSEGVAKVREMAKHFVERATSGKILN